MTGDCSKVYSQNKEPAKVASVDFNETSIDYYLSDAGVSKASSPAPCAVFMCKPGFEENKSMFCSKLGEMSLEFSDAFGNPVLASLAFKHMLLVESC